MIFLKGSFSSFLEINFCRTSHFCETNIPSPIATNKMFSFIAGIIKVNWTTCQVRQIIFVIGLT